MTPEEKNALLQFMGTTYGHSHKLDTHIVGNSQFVKPISTTVKEAFEQVLKSDTTSTPRFVQEVSPPNEPVVLHERADRDIPVLQHNKPIEIPVQHTYNTGEYHEKIYLELKRIGDTLETLAKAANNVKPRKKIKDTI